MWRTLSPWKFCSSKNQYKIFISFSHLLCRFVWSRFSCFPLCLSYVLESFLLYSRYFCVRISFELQWKPCGCGLWRSSAPVLSADQYCRERQQPPLFPPFFLYAPSFYLTFTLPYSQSAWCSLFYLLQVHTHRYIIQKQFDKNKFGGLQG